MPKGHFKSFHDDVTRVEGNNKIAVGEMRLEVTTIQPQKHLDRSCIAETAKNPRNQSRHVLLHTTARVFF